MRVWFSGPRLFGIRPGISLGRSDFRRPAGWSKSGPSGQSDQVYAISGSHGLVKVGFSRDPIARLQTLQTGSPFGLSLAYTCETYGHGAQVEAEAHEILAKHRHDGEWFAVPVDVAVAAISAAAYRIGSKPEPQPTTRWWPRYLVATALFGTAFSFDQPVPFLAVSFGLLFWAGLKSMWYRGLYTWRLAGQWALFLVALIPSIITVAVVIRMIRG